MRASRSADNRLVVFVGDIHGEFDTLHEYLDRITRRYGKIDAVIATGDVQATRSPDEELMIRRRRHRIHESDFGPYATGKRRLPAPLYFIGGNHEPWEALDTQGPGSWAPGVVYLGRAGVANIAGLNVAFLSGVYSDRLSGRALPRETPRSRTFWNVHELARVGSANEIDVLVTHDWPSRVGSIVDLDIPTHRGNAEIAELADRLQPTLHVVGHRHRNARITSGRTTLVALTLVERGIESVAPFEVGPENQIAELGMVITPDYFAR